MFDKAVELYDNAILAYYYDLSFEETLRRHETKEERFEFGEEDMRRWWSEKDYIGFIPEKIINENMSLEETVDLIFSDLV